MTNRRERRLFWFFVFWCGIALSLLPLLLPDSRYPALNLSAGAVLIAAASWRLWLLRRHVRRESWNPED